MNKDVMPIGCVGNTTISTAQKQFSYVVKWDNGTSVTFTQMGHLALAGVIKTGKTYYCPSEESDPLFIYDSPDNPYPFKPGINPFAPLNHHLRFGYNTRPIADWFITPQDPIPYLFPCRDYASDVRGLPRQSKMKNKAVVSDIILERKSVLNRHKRGVNVLYANGSAQWVELKELENSPQPASNTWMQTDGTVDAKWNAAMLDESDPNKPTGVWIAMDRASH
jgi:hypothetical protein